MSFAVLIPRIVPASWGILEPIKVIAPAGTVVNALPPAPVAGGNVETSQRIVDTLLLALSRAGAAVPAASQGTMNNLTIGGTDIRTDRQFAYYETVAGGMGARPGLDGIDGIHTHMTNSLNTPAEAMEYAYPMRVRATAIRPGSGGSGRFRGGDGVVREIELLTDAQVTILSDRRKTRPYGLDGGEPGAPAARSYNQRWRTSLAGKDSITLTQATGFALNLPAAAALESKSKSEPIVEYYKFMQDYESTRAALSFLIGSL